MYPKSRMQLAQLYGFCTRTFTTRLKEAGIELKPRRLVSPGKQIEIFARFGIPYTLSEAEAAVMRPKVRAYCREKDILIS